MVRPAWEDLRPWGEGGRGAAAGGAGSHPAYTALAGGRKRVLSARAGSLVREVFPH